MSDKVVPILSDEEAARRYRLRVAQRLLDAFKAGHDGRECDTVEELDEWLETDEGQAVLAKTPLPAA